MRLPVVLVFAFYYLTSVLCQGTVSSCNSSDCYPAGLNKLRRVLIQYTASFLCYFNSNFPNENAVGSPGSSLYILAALGLYSCNGTQTYRDIFAALQQKNKKELESSISELNEYLTTYPRGIIYTVNGSNFFGKLENPFTDGFKQSMKYLITGGVNNFDFSDIIATIEEINEMIQDETENYITEVVTEGDGYVTNDTSILAVTALYFEPEYKIRFIKGKFQPFYITPDNSVKTLYVNVRAMLNYTYSEELRATIVEFPMSGLYTNMVIFPDEGTNMGCLIKKLPQFYDSIRDSMKVKALDVSLPAFNNITTTMNISRIADQSFHIPTIYNEEAEFCGMVKNDTQVYISNGVQKFVYKSSIKGKPAPALPKGMKIISVIVNGPYLDIVEVNGIPIICAKRIVP